MDKFINNFFKMEERWKWKTESRAQVMSSTTQAKQKLTNLGGKVGVH